jgi:lipoyl(octanoyl) transferase
MFPHTQLYHDQQLISLASFASVPKQPKTKHRRRNSFVNSAHDHSHLKATVYDLHSRLVPYEDSWKWQKALVDLHASPSPSPPSSLLGSILLLQHPPVYTLGAGATESHLKFDPSSPPAPLYRIERGGEVTYHGPGQLVAYPILSLQRLKPDLHWYLRSLEEIVIETLDEVSGIRGERVEGLTGVWVEGSKVAAIGVRASRWITYHGLALNVVADLEPFKEIVPCGIVGRAVGSVKEVLMKQAAEEDPFYRVSCGDDGGYGEGRKGPELNWSDEELLDEYAVGLMDAMEGVLGIEVEVVGAEESVRMLEELVR